MIAKQVTYKKMPEAIRVAFEGDKDIFSLFDPNVKVETVDDIVNDISKKLQGWGEHGDVHYFGVYNKNELSGYFAYRNKMLISFALTTKLRTRNYLNEFFSLIKKELNGKFEVVLWNRNTRGLKWVQKQGMKAVGGNEFITRLVNY